MPAVVLLASAAASVPKYTTFLLIMKKEGNKGYNYCLEVVAAEGLNAPFPEHVAPDGTTYAEVEPDAEYFVRADVRDGGGAIPRLLADLYVDEERKRKGYCLWKKKNNKPILGFSSYFDGVKTVTAFKFNKIGSGLGPNVTSGGSAGTVPPSIGKIRIEFYESQYRGPPKHGREYKADSAQTWSGRNVDASGIGKKVLKSTSGDTIRSIKESRPSPYKKGKFVESIELKYCTAQGLIHAGIWPKASASAAAVSQGPAEIIDLTDADDMPAKKKAKTESGPVDLTDE